jgi:hypothetical protein
MESMAYVSKCMKSGIEVDYPQEMIIQLALMQDKLFLKCGLEEEDFQ